ncbi:hypothetical protein GH714_030778 [Hevea brasiliensis]|uniref:G-patch domain-containing protein n=1 Tax=Hevea brasiliensis TaxID=3981 RepID=A0A6A6K358_HEVBR|nr:hypothetical protein GH714_043566 [Hevea brasiliensis]KAF2299143.1 hypothetical protein GH714_030778 [Hevea brasiliensis]
MIPPKENEWPHRRMKNLDLIIQSKDCGLEEFEDAPVEGFGAALLAGYGWYKGRGIGRNAKEEGKIEFREKIGRNSREGLGYVSLNSQNPPETSQIRMTEGSNQQPSSRSLIRQNWHRQGEAANNSRSRKR